MASFTTIATMTPARSGRFYSARLFDGLEGIVSKRRERTYKAGLCKDWTKVKNPRSPAMKRAKDAF
jgi:ATP-dependent DNA ligase